MTRANSHSSALLGRYEVILESQTVPYIVERSFKAKYVWLKVNSRMGLTVVIPASYNVKELPCLLVKRRHWILGKLARYGKPHLPSTKRGIKSGDFVPYLGRHLKVIERVSPGTPEGITLKATRIVVNSGSRDGRLTELIECWYRQQAECLLKKRTDELCCGLGVSYNRLSIRRVKTRWGSCSQKGNLNFNWRLIMAPEPVIEYVIIHELMHLKELNHSKKFWGLVAEHCSQWRKYRKWLKDHEVDLASVPWVQD